MSHFLENNDAVQCTSEEQYLRILDLAIKAGLRLGNYTKARKGFKNHPFLYWNADSEELQSSSDTRRPTIDEGAFIARMFGAGTPPLRTIRIAGHVAEFLDTGDVKVGCTTVPYDTLKEVFDRATAKKNA